MPVSVKIGGVWKTATAVYNKVGGVWKTAADMPVKIAGVWKTGILASNSYESIATLTPTSGTTATFSSIPSTYKSLQIRMQYYTTAGTNNSVGLDFNASGTGYKTRRLFGNGTTVGSSSPFAPDRIAINGDYGNIANNPNVFIVDIIDYSSTTKNKTIKVLQGQNENTTGVTNSVSLGAGLWVNTAAISSISILVGAAFSSGTSIALYGIKG